MGETPILFICFYFLAVPYGIFVPRPGMGGMQGWSLNPWTTKEVPGKFLFQIEPFGHIPLRNCQKEYPRAKALGRQRLRGALPCRPGEGGEGREVRQELPREAKPPAHVLRHWEGEFPAGPVVENLPVNAGDMCSIPGQGRSQSSEATNPMCHNY